MATARAIRFHESGGPDVLRVESVEVGDPGPGEARVRHQAIGVNFIETYQRSGLYSVPLPSGLGTEAAGIVEAVGPDVDWVQPGMRVGYNGGPLGAYSDVRILPARHLLRLPDVITSQVAAACLLKGMTAAYLIRKTFPVRAGMTVLWHAAAGGVGLIACQWLRELGAIVIGTVGSDEKAELAASHGCQYPIVYTRDDFVTRVKEITGGKGVPVVYDSVGKSTFLRSLECLSLRGTMVSFGNASGKPDPVDPLELSQRGSLYLTRPHLGHYTGTREELTECADALFHVVESGAVRVEVRQTFPLEAAADAHRALESRTTSGSTVLLP